MNILAFTVLFQKSADHDDHQSDKYDHGYRDENTERDPVYEVLVRQRQIGSCQNALVSGRRRIGRLLKNRRIRQTEIVRGLRKRVFRDKVHLQLSRKQPYEPFKQRIDHPVVQEIERTPQIHEQMCRENHADERSEDRQITYLPTIDRCRINTALLRAKPPQKQNADRQQQNDHRNGIVERSSDTLPSERKNMTVVEHRDDNQEYDGDRAEQENERRAKCTQKP